MGEEKIKKTLNNLEKSYSGKNKFSSLRSSSVQSASKLDRFSKIFKLLNAVKIITKVLIKVAR